MSPLRACLRHGRANCQRCAADTRAKARASRRSYSGTAEERRMRLEVLETYGERCVYCSAPIDLEVPGGSTDDALELAHVIPHVDGGLFTVDNLRPAHRGCNRRAGARMDAAIANAHTREDLY